MNSSLVSFLDGLEFVDKKFIFASFGEFFHAFVPRSKLTLESVFDEVCEHPMSIFSVIKKHFAIYTPDRNVVIDTTVKERDSSSAKPADHFVSISFEDVTNQFSTLTNLTNINFSFVTGFSDSLKEGEAA